MWTSLNYPMTQTLELQKSYGQGSGLAVCISSEEIALRRSDILRSLSASSSIKSIFWMMMRTDALRLECKSFIDSIVLEQL